jgi:hypothetical protein
LTHTKFTFEDKSGYNNKFMGIPAKPIQHKVRCFIDKYIDWSLVLVKIKYIFVASYKKQYKNINKYSKSRKKLYNAIENSRSNHNWIWDNGIGFNLKTGYRIEKYRKN